MDWQKPYREILEKLDFEWMPETSYGWNHVTQDQKAELEKLALENGFDDIAEDILTVRGSKADLKLAFNICRLAAFIVQQGTDPAKGFMPSDFGHLSEIFPVAFVYLGDFIAWYRHPSATKELYRGCLQEIIYEANIILSSVEKPSLPDYSNV